MRKLLVFISLALMLVACSPQAITMLVDKKIVPDCGVDLDGKSVCVVYVQNDNYRDSVFSINFSDGLAQGIEKQFFDGDKAVEVFSLKAEDGADYSDRDSLIRYVLETNSDVVMLLDASTEHKEASDDKNEYTAKLFVYDSMNKADKVVPLESVCNVTSPDLDNSSFMSDAQFSGYMLSQKFSLDWKAEQYTILYFESIDNQWTEAVAAAMDNRIDEAIDIWMQLADNPKDNMKSSCASYNIAVVCHLIGQDSLAAEWLDKSDKEYPISLSTGLRKRITAAQ